MRMLTCYAVLMLACATACAADAKEPDAVEPAVAGLSAPRLAQMEQPIRAGDFKQITRVLLARGGKLAFERYLADAPGAR